MLEALSRKEPKGDIKPSCLLAVGLLQNTAAVPELLAIVQNGKTSTKGSEGLDDNVVAYAIGALGKIGEPGLAEKGQETVVIDELILPIAIEACVLVPIVVVAIARAEMVIV